MSFPVIEVVDPGLGGTFQDRGRVGWRRYGVPLSGPMDDHAANWANRVLGNGEGAPLIEFSFRPATLLVLAGVWVAMTGPEAESNFPLWRAVYVNKGDLLHVGPSRAGLWFYLAVESGFDCPRVLGSGSAYLRGEIGRVLQKGDVLCTPEAPKYKLPEGVTGRFVSDGERRRYDSPPVLRVWPGPQWDRFAAVQKELFFSQEWVVSADSDRVGFRLEGESLMSVIGQLISEPMLPGTVQIPDNGKPMVMMRDGPTIGGYPKLGVVEAEDLSWLSQCQAGSKVRFRLHPSAEVTHQ